MEEKLMISLSKAMKDELGKYATARNTSIASVVRSAVAKEIKFDLTAEPTTTHKKYNSVEERKAAQQARDKERRELIKKLLNDYKASK